MVFLGRAPLITRYYTRYVTRMITRYMGVITRYYTLGTVVLRDGDQYRTVVTKHIIAVHTEYMGKPGQLGQLPAARSELLSRFARIARV